MVVGAVSCNVVVSDRRITGDYVPDDRGQLPVVRVFPSPCSSIHPYLTPLITQILRRGRRHVHGQVVAPEAALVRQVQPSGLLWELQQDEVRGGRSRSYIKGRRYEGGGIASM